MEIKGSLIAFDFLSKQSVPKKQIETVIDIIENISFSKGTYANKSKSLELQVVQDADRLDAIGAIGIAESL